MVYGRCLHVACERARGCLDAACEGSGGFLGESGGVFGFWEGSGGSGGCLGGVWEVYVGVWKESRGVGSGRGLVDV